MRRTPSPARAATAAALLAALLLALPAAAMAAPATPSAVGSITPATGEPPDVPRGEGNWAARLDLADAFCRAYEVPGTRLVMPADTPRGLYDFRFTGYADAAALHAAVRAELERTFGLRGRREQRTLPVYVLQPMAGRTPNLAWESGAHSPVTFQNGWMDGEGIDSAMLARAMEAKYGVIIVDELRRSEPFDVHVFSKGRGTEDLDTTSRDGLRSGLNLDVEPAQRAVEVLVVEHAGATAPGAP